SFLTVLSQITHCKSFLLGGFLQ
ncbi:hypothetical protein CP082626L3_0185B, partial [Chlamydia psittaci 08-2626_L3]